MKSMMPGRFGSKRVAVIGAGAIGCITAKQLVSEGMRITLIDRDFVEECNLGRQLLYEKSDVGKPKAIAAKTRLKEGSGKAMVNAVVADLNYKNANLLAGHDLVLDCTDNFEARFLINDYCRKNSVPWIYAAAVRDMGSIYSVMPSGPCFRCVFDSHHSVETCDTAGVSMGVVSTVSGIQVEEAVNILLNSRPAEEGMVRIGKNLLKLSVKKNQNCPACRGSYEYLAGKRGSRAVKLCGSNSYQVKGRKIDLRKLLLQLRRGKVMVKDFSSCIHFNSMTVFADGRAIIKAPSEEKARSLYSRYVA